MKCSKCSKTAIYSSPDLCSDHLVKFVRAKAKETIRKYELIKPRDKIVVAVSGGKDSLTVLDVLSFLKYKVSALVIDEGIADYRDHTIVDLKKFCKERKIKLKTVSFKSAYGRTLDGFVKKNSVPPCRVCGVFRRQLLNKNAKGFDVIATGHNLDDELQSVMMNLWKGAPELLARLGPRTGVVMSKKFVPRVKPLYFIPEKMVKVYTIIQGFDVKFVECPYASESFRHKIGTILNEWESDQPGAKEQILKTFLKRLPSLKKQYIAGELELCPKCGSPSAGGECRACKFARTLK